jgi:penicillin amidase
MQAYAFDANAPMYVPLLLQLEELSNGELQAQDLLRDWDFQSWADSSAAAIFNAFWRHLLQNTFNDDLPEERYYPEGGSRWNEIMRNLDDSSPWWDDKTTTDIKETRIDIIRKSFEQGIAELEDIFGRDPANWNWGDMHTSTFRNGTLGESGVPPIEALFNRGPFSTGGGESIVNATGWSIKEGYQTTSLPSMRMIVDLGSLSNSVTVHTTGQSGHAYHPHYADMAQLWANVEYYSMLWEEGEIASQAEGHLVLTPK